MNQVADDQVRVPAVGADDALLGVGYILDTKLSGAGLVGLVGLACAGAFLMMAALTLGRSLREGLYLSSFALDSLHQVTAAVVLLGS